MGAAVDRLVEVVAALREHCLWTAALTHGQLVEYLVEESYELVEAIEDRRPDEELRGELADVLLQVVLHSAIASERGAFDFEAVADTLTAKMIRRNTHVFAPDGSLRGSFPESVEEIVASWDAAKRSERPTRTGPFEGLPKHLPALMLADKALGRGERWLALEGVPAPHAAEAYAARVRGDVPAFSTEDELGDHLLAVVQAARSVGLDPERALRAAVVRFTDGGWRP